MPIFATGLALIMSDEYLVLYLRSPFWSAYQKYHWDDRVEGYGISYQLIQKAIKLNKKIMVIYNDTSYVISPKQALKKINYYHSVYIARNGIQIGVVPRTAFKKV